MKLRFYLNIILDEIGFISYISKFLGFKAINEDLAVGINQSATSSPAMKEKKIRARPLGQQAVQEQDLKPEFRLKVIG